MRSKLKRLYLSFGKRLLVLYSKLKKVDTETYSKVSKLKINGKLAKLHSGEEEALYTGRFIDILKIPDLRDLGISCNNFEECSKGVLSLHDEIAKKLKEDFLSVYDSFPKVDRDYLRTVTHEYVHWSMLSGTKTAVVLEKLAWKERIDTMYFTYLFYSHVNLGKLVGKGFAREDKADIIGEGLSETEAVSKIKEISEKIDEFSRKDEALNAFLDVLKDYFTLISIGNVISLVVEPTTWAIVEDQTYFTKYADIYFDNPIRKEFAKKMYDFALTHKPEEVINRVRGVLNSIDVLSLISLEDEKIIEELGVNFSKSQPDVPRQNLSLKDVVPELVREYLKDKSSQRKIDILTEGVLSDTNVLKYVIKTLPKLKSEMSKDSLPSICYNIAWRDSLIAGCYNPDVGINGKKPVYRPFGSFEEIVGNLALSFKLSLLLAIRYAQDLEYGDNQYCKIVAKLADRAKFFGVDFYKVACNEVRQIVDPKDLRKIVFYLDYMNMGRTDLASKALKAFLVYWTYLVLRTGRKSPAVLGSRHGIYTL